MNKNSPWRVALTFDDGTIKQYYAIKVLSKFHVRCTIFCVTHLKKHPRTNEQMLASEPEKIQELHSLGHEIGSHTCTHPDLTKISLEKMRYELRESKLVLEDITGSEIVGFAYPYSIYNQQVLKEVRNFYGYARSGGRYSQDEWNIKTNDRYRIGSIGIKKTLLAPYKLMQYQNRAIVVMIHNLSSVILLSIVFYLRLLFPQTKFVTMSKIVEELERAGMRRS